MEYLMFHKGKVISAEEIIEHVWGSEVDLFSTPLNIACTRTRKYQMPMSWNILFNSK
ncbi:winged helix-turn-helix domain-containing protein [Lacrimispora sp.]|uniref:winged helix-turn-helix domain-containing protein n=1 Tax=Lacrimispora sp. TaxID=2719234 RepID=UPI0028AA97B7|nr:helix-turn-helix domain-containing protein [Lacrimispora sp.]